MPRPPSNETPEQIAERKRGYSRKWRANNREKARQSGRDWRANNIDTARQMTREWIAKWRKNNPEKMKETNRRQQLRRIGLTQADVDRMLEEQNDRCAICKKESKRWHIDHCHTTGRIRGVLCPLCNKGLGHFKDDPAALLAAIKYLKT